MSLRKRRASLHRLTHCRHVLWRMVSAVTLHCISLTLRDFLGFHFHFLTSSKDLSFFRVDELGDTIGLDFGLFLEPLGLPGGRRCSLNPVGVFSTSDDAVKEDVSVCVVGRSVHHDHEKEGQDHFI